MLSDIEKAWYRHRCHRYRLFSTETPPILAAFDLLVQSALQQLPPQCQWCIVHSLPIDIDVYCAIHTFSCLIFIFSFRLFDDDYFSGNTFIFDLKLQQFWQLTDVRVEDSSCLTFVPTPSPPSLARNRRTDGSTESNSGNLILIGTSAGKIYAVNFGIYHVYFSFFFSLFTSVDRLWFSFFTTYGSEWGGCFECV